ncbi:MAG: beta-ketoacyl-ACP synthase III [Xanthobacteraceae bacterium]|nr:beta-ketoacyl-ACP synthase III [Xanthobacteraceae bacterium]
MILFSQILGLGHHAPYRDIPNSEIESSLGLDAGWIEQRTGIKSRRWSEPHEATTDIAKTALERAMDDAGLSGLDIDLVLLATSTPDHLLPPSGSLLAHKVGAINAGAIDLTGACSGFVYAMVLADGFVRTQNKTVAVVAANTLSRRLNRADRTTSVIFADAAGAVIIGPTHAAGGLRGSQLLSDGSKYDLIKIEAGGSRAPYGPQTRPEDTFISISSGREVFSDAVRLMAQTAQAAMTQANITAAGVDRFIPHQANVRIVDAVCKKIGLDPARAALTLDRYGNSSAATVPLTLSIEHARKRFQQGEVILCSAAGAGLSAGSFVWQF